MLHLPDILTFCQNDSTTLRFLTQLFFYQVSKSPGGNIAPQPKSLLLCAHEGPDIPWGTPEPFFYTVLALGLRVSITEQNSREWAKPQKDSVTGQGRPSHNLWL